MSGRMSFALAVLLLLLAAGLRWWDIATLPPGFNRSEIMDIRIAESVRLGRIEVFYDLTPLGGQGGREGLYHILLALTTSFTGGGLIGYRALSVFSSLLTLALVYAVGLRLYGRLAGLAALALLALGMYPILLAREISSESLLPLLAAAIMLALVKALPVDRQHDRHEPGTITFTSLGLLLGLGFYVDPAHFLIALYAMLFIGYMVAARRPLSRRAASYISFALLLLIILAVPYVLSSVRLPGLDGAGRVFGAYTADQLSPLQAIWNGVRGLLFVGDENPVMNLPGRPMFDLVSAVFILLGFLTMLRSARRPRYMALLLALFILSPVAFLNPASPDFGRYAVLLPALALLFGLGVAAVYQGLRAGTRRVLVAGLVGLLIFNLGWTARDLFTLWPRLPDVQQAYHTRIAQLAHHIDLTAETTPTVLCTRSVFPSPHRQELTLTQLLLLMLHRTDAPVRYVDCGTGLVFTSGGERQQVIMIHPEALGNAHPYLRAWLDHGEMLTSPDLPPDSVIVMDVAQALADKIGLFTTTAEVEYAPETTGAGSDAVIYPPVHFGGNIAFLGYEREPVESYLPGSIVTGISFWRVDGPLPPDMRLFTHILSDPANIIAQADTRSVVPGMLRPRDVFIQIMFLTLPQSTPDGEYSMSVGAYQDSDRMRMVVLDNNTARGNRLFLADNRITVRRPVSE